MRGPVPVPSNSVVHLAITHCCAPANHSVRGPCIGNGRRRCGRSLVSHCGQNRLVDTSDVRFPSSVGCGALRAGHVICNNNNVVPSIFVPISASHCASCRHDIITTNLIGHVTVGCLSHRHTRLGGGCPGFTRCGRGFGIASSVVRRLIALTGSSGVRFGRRRCGHSGPLVVLRVGTLVTHSLCSVTRCFRIVGSSGRDFRRTLHLVGSRRQCGGRLKQWACCQWCFLCLCSSAGEGRRGE